MAKIRVANANGANRKVQQHDFNNIEDVQKYNNRQVYTKGFINGTSANTTTEFNIQLGGACRKLHGIVIINPVANEDQDDIISLKINSETVIDKVNWKAYSPKSIHNAFKTEQYFAIPRGLSGADEVILTIASVAAKNSYIVFYLSNA